MEAKLKDKLLLYLSFLIYSVSSLFSKVVSQQKDLPHVIVFLGLEVFFLGVYAILWQQVLKRFPLSLAMARKGVTVVYALLWSVLLFHESITVSNIVGVILVMIGIGIVSRDD